MRQFICVAFMLAGAASGHAAYQYSGGCASICFQACEDYSSRPMPAAKCPGVDPESPDICKILYGNCAKAPDGGCAWRPGADFNACLRAPRSYAAEFKALQEALIKKRNAAMSGDNCPESLAKELAKSDPRIVKFCSAKVNGQNHGCIFESRPPSSKNADEIRDPKLKWLVTASIIHSYDPQRRPRFMPEGTAFLKISKACEVTGIMGPMGLPLQ